MPSRGPFPPNLFDGSVIQCLYGSEIRNRLGTLVRKLGGGGEGHRAPAKCFHACAAAGMVRAFHLGMMCCRGQFLGSGGKGICHLK